MAPVQATKKVEPANTWKRRILALAGVAELLCGIVLLVAGGALTYFGGSVGTGKEPWRFETTRHGV
jgi:hypothetical protein